MLTEFLAVGIGGFVGSCFRYAISRGMSGLPAISEFPYTTLVSNVIAGFLIGLITVLSEDSDVITARQKLMLTTGMLGGLSTFSTFSMETIRMIQHGHEINALGNIILNISLSLFGVILGMALGRYIAKGI